MPELTMTLSDAEREELQAMAEEMGLSPEEASAEFIRLQMMRIANAQSLPEPAVVIPIQSDRKRPGR